MRPDDRIMLAVVLGLAMVCAAPQLFTAALSSCSAQPSSDRCTGDTFERFDDAWERWAVDGLPMRDCDGEALQDMRALAAGD